MAYKAQSYKINGSILSEITENVKVSGLNNINMLHKSSAKTIGGPIAPSQVETFSRRFAWGLGGGFIFYTQHISVRGTLSFSEGL